MNTIKKGDQLEDKIYNLFTEEISAGRFFATKECCQIFKKKGYYSKDRKKDIIFDVSIEITLPGEQSYSILVLIECKNYNHKVPVDDVEEFFSKAQQISGCNIKGILVSTNSFQEGTFNYSQSKGIGLLKYYNRESLDWVLTRSPSGMAFSDKTEWYSVYQGLRSENHTSKFFDCYCFIDEIYTHSLNQFISRLVKKDLDDNSLKSLAKIEVEVKSKIRLVPYKENQEIETFSNNVLKDIAYKKGAVPLKVICSKLQNKYDLEVQHNSNLDSGVLGTISFDPLLVRIDDNQSESKHRIRFTLAHELGHLLLGHQKYMVAENCHTKDIDLETPRNIMLKDIVRMEWQANYFASCLLLPEHQFITAFLIESAKNELVDRGHGLLYLDDQACNLDTFYKITGPLMNQFDVSRSVVKIRLIRLGFINEKQNAQQLYSLKNKQRGF